MASGKLCIRMEEFIKAIIKKITSMDMEELFTLQMKQHKMPRDTKDNLNKVKSMAMEKR